MKWKNKTVRKGAYLDRDRQKMTEEETRLRDTAAQKMRAYPWKRVISFYHEGKRCINGFRRGKERFSLTAAVKSQFHCCAGWAYCSLESRRFLRQGLWEYRGLCFCTACRVRRAGYVRGGYTAPWRRFDGQRSLLLIAAFCARRV